MQKAVDVLQLRHALRIQVETRDAVQIMAVGEPLPERNHPIVESVPCGVIARLVAGIILLDKVGRRGHARAGSIFRMRSRADTHISFSSGVPMVIRTQDGSPKDLSGRTMTPSRKSDSNRSRAWDSEANGIIKKLASDGSGAKPKRRKAAVIRRNSRAFISRDLAMNSRSSKAAMAAAEAALEGSKGSLTFSSMPIRSWCAKPYPTRNPASP